MTAAVLNRADVTLLPDKLKKGSADGMYIERSRRNSSSSPQRVSPSTCLSSKKSSELECYNLKRLIVYFFSLEDRLETRHECIVVLPLPSMAIACSSHHMYGYNVQRLENFQRKLATHTVLSTTDEVLSFLRATIEKV